MAICINQICFLSLLLLFVAKKCTITIKNSIVDLPNIKKIGMGFAKSVSVVCGMVEK